MSDPRPAVAPEPSADLQITTQVLAALRRIIRAIDLHSRSLVQRYGLTGPQLVVLKELIDRPPQSVSALAAAVNLSQATVTGILDRLERKDMVTRTRDRRDKRKVLVSPTAGAEARPGRRAPLLQEHFTAAFARLPDWEQTQILSSLQRIVALMEAGDVEAGRSSPPGRWMRAPRVPRPTSRLAGRASTAREGHPPADGGTSRVELKHIVC
jgi:DNA-binding MarR family transcriptional regulator